MSNKNHFLNDNPGLLLLVSYLNLFVVSCFGLMVAASLFPINIVLGTFSLSFSWSIFLSMAVLSWINTFAIPLVREWEKKQQKMLSSRDWMMLYFGLNFAGLWLISRFSQQFGLGISSWVYVVGLALWLDFLQGLAMMWMEKWRQG